MKKFLFIAVALCALTMMSCESDESLSGYKSVSPEEPISVEQAYEMYKDTIAALGLEESERFFYKTRFMSLADQEKYGLWNNETRSQIDPFAPIDPEQNEFRIKFHFETGISFLGRCIGYGFICKIDFEVESEEEGLSMQMGSDEGIVQTDSLGNSYCDILLNSAPESGATVPPLTVNQDIVGEVYIPSELEIGDEIEIPSSYTLPQGNYLYNSDLGVFGGYRLYFNENQ